MIRVYSPNSSPRALLYTAHRVHGGYQLVHRIIVVVRTHLVIRGVVILVGTQETNQVPQPVKLPGGMMPHRVHHKAHEVQVIIAIPALAQLIANRHAAASPIIAVLDRASIRQRYNSGIRRHPLIAVTQRISVRVNNFRYTSIGIILELVDTTTGSRLRQPASLCDCHTYRSNSWYPGHYCPTAESGSRSRRKHS